MKAEPLGFMPPAPGQRSLDLLVSRWSWRLNWAAIVSCLEPVVTTLSAVAVYGERLTLSQVIGGTAVLAAVVVLRRR